MDRIMDVMHHQLAEHEAQRLQANREELVERIARAARRWNRPVASGAVPVPLSRASGAPS